MTNEKVEIGKKEIIKSIFKKKVVKWVMIGLAAYLIFGFVWAHTEEGKAEIASNEAEQEAEQAEQEAEQAEQEAEQAEQEAEQAEQEAENEAKKDEVEDNQAEREADKAQQEVLATVPLETQYGVGTYVVGEDIPAGDYWITPTIEEDLHKTSCEINYGGDSDTVVNMNVTNQMIELDNGDVVTVTENCYIELREHAS